MDREQELPPWAALRLIASNSLHSWRSSPQGRRRRPLGKGSERHAAFLHSPSVVGVLLRGLGREQVVVGGVEEGLVVQRSEDVGTLDLHTD